MKFSRAVILAAATGAYADIATIKSVLGDVSTSIESLDTAAQGFNGDVDSVQSKAEDLVKTINGGKAKVDGSGDLTLNDALGLTDPVQALTKKAQTLADHFKARRSEVEKVGACGTVRKQLSAINGGSQGLIESVVSKVPKDAQSIAEQLAGGLTEVLKKAQDDFSESNCKNSGGSSPGQSGSASQTGGASQTSAPVESTAAPTGGESSAPATTMAPSTTAAAVPTGGNTTATGVPPPVTAGASFLAPAGALVMAVAAALL